MKLGVGTSQRMTSLDVSSEYSHINDSEIQETNVITDTNTSNLDTSQEIYCGDDFIVCNDAHHGVSYSIEGTVFSCRFSFRSPKNISRENRMKYLRTLYDSMTKRVDDAYNDLAD
jgi:hypothetical protein